MKTFQTGLNVSDTILTKEYIFRNDYDQEDPLEYGGPQLIKAKGCTINWKSGKNPGVRIIKKKQKPKGNGVAKIVTKEEKRNTFFTFFTPPDFSVDETEKYGDDEYDEAFAFLEKDFKIGQNIQKLINKPVLYFTGEADDINSSDDED